jgi:hypothetical protein
LIKALTKGHNLAIILTALQDMTGSTSEALQIAEKYLDLKEVIPSQKKMFIK